MTAPVPAATTAEPNGTPETARRWHRAAIPLGFAALLFLVTGITYAVEEPDPTDADFLSPVSIAPVGSNRLADALAARGVRVHRLTRTSDALVAAYRGEATLFVPVPGVLHPAYLGMLALLPASTRVVFVDPPDAALRAAKLPLATSGRRWTAGVAAPGTADDGCALPEAQRAGAAAALRQRYRWADERLPGWAADPPQADRCYDGGLLRLRLRSAGPELVVVGATDPFRNDRIGEHRNGPLATGLLTGHPDVIWLDVHRPDPPPGVVDDPAGDPAAPPSLAPDPHRRGARGDGDGVGVRQPDGRTGRNDEGGGGDTQARTGGGTSPLWDAFPLWFWAMLAQFALAALVYAWWRARRLGPPVAEPLPVTVPSAETVRGHGRLYRRARAHGPAAATLRQAALRRVLPLLGLRPGVAPREVIDALARQTGQDPTEIEAVLYGPEPTHDEELVRLARALDTLADLVATPPTGSDATDEGVQA